MSDGLLTIELTICRPCLSGTGGECHTPGCALWLHSVDVLPIDPSSYRVVGSQGLGSGDASDGDEEDAGSPVSRSPSPDPRAASAGSAIPTGDLLGDLDRFLDDRAPCDADLEAMTNGAHLWLSLRDWADELKALQSRSTVSGSATPTEACDDSSLLEWGAHLLTEGPATPTGHDDG